MTPFEKEIQKFEKRPATLAGAEQRRRASMYKHFSAINKFEGITTSPADERLLQLLISGKITKREYLDLCLIDARSTIQ